MIRVLIADESRQVTDNISRRLALEEDLEVCGTADGGESAVEQALWLKPDIAVVDAGLPGMDGSQTTQMIVQSLPSTGVIMMSMEVENEAYRLAMSAGAREFLQKPFKGDDLVGAVRRVHELMQRRGVPTAPVEGAEADTSGTKTYVTADRLSTRGAVTAIVSGKGGVGRTTVAINLAALLAESHRGRVALVDLSLQFGDVGAALNLRADHTISDLFATAATADAEALAEVMATGPGSVRVLLAPTSAELADVVTPAHVTSLFDALRNEYDFIIVDTPAYLTEVAIHAVELADHVVMLSDLSVTGVKNARLTRTVLQTVGIDPTSVVVVANHRDTAAELDRRGAEGFLGARIAVEIPNSAELVATSINKGIPFVTSNPSSAPSVAMQALAAIIDPLSQNGSEDAANRGPSEKSKAGRRRLFKR